MNVVTEVYWRSNCFEVVQLETCGSEVSRKNFWRSNFFEVVWEGGAVVSQRKERARGVCEEGLTKIKIDQDGKRPCRRVCEEVCWRVRRKQEVGSGACWVEVGSGACCWQQGRRGVLLARDLSHRGRRMQGWRLIIARLHGWCFKLLCFL